MHINEPVGAEIEILKALKFLAEKLWFYSTGFLNYNLTALVFF